MMPVACVENIGYDTFGQVGLDVTWTFEAEPAVVADPAVVALDAVPVNVPLTVKFVTDNLLAKGLYVIVLS